MCMRADERVSEGARVCVSPGIESRLLSRAAPESGVDRDLESAVNVELAATGRWRCRGRIMPSPAEGKTFGYFSRA